MTVPSTTRKAGPFNGNGSTTTFAFSFKVFAASDIKVTIADNLGAETVLVLNSHYSVSLNANQDTSPGGSVTYPLAGSALPSGYKLAIAGSLAYDQPLDLPSGGNFSPIALENELDRQVMQIQQLTEQVGRAVLAPVTSNASGQLPAPQATSVIGWNSTGTALQNYGLAELSTAVSYASMFYDTFTGNGVQTQFVLTSNPAMLANLDVAIDGLTQLPTTDYTLTGQTVSFAVAPPNGSQILMRYGQALPVVEGDQYVLRAGSTMVGALTTPTLNATDVNATTVNATGGVTSYGAMVAREAGGLLFFGTTGGSPYGTNYDRFQISMYDGPQRTYIGNYHGGSGSARALSLVAGSVERMQINLDGSFNFTNAAGTMRANIDSTGTVYAANAHSSPLGYSDFYTYFSNNGYQAFSTNQSNNTIDLAYNSLGNYVGIGMVVNSVGTTFTIPKNTTVGGRPFKIITKDSITNADKTFSFDPSGNATAVNGSWVDGSDATLKENVANLSDCLTKILAMRPVGYNLIGSERADIGFIAQEMQSILPQVVADGEKLGIAYGRLTAVLVGAIQELAAEIEALKNGA